MSNSGVFQIGIDDFIELAVSLIAYDIQVHNQQYWLSDHEVYPPPIQLQLHKRILSLIGFKKEEINIELEEWYFKKAEQGISIDIINNEKALLELSAEILKELNEKLVESKRSKFAS